MDSIAQRIASAKSFNALEGALSGDRLLAQPLIELVVRLPVNDAMKRAILRAGNPDSTLGSFFLRMDIHRTLAEQFPYAELLLAFKQALLTSVPTSEPSLEAADAFGDLLRFVEGSPIGRRPLIHVLGELVLPPRIQKRLTLMSGRVSVAEFLRNADNQAWSDREFFEVLDAFKDWLRRELALATPQPSNVVTLPLPEVSLESLAARIRDTGIPDLGDWSLEMLEGRPREYNSSKLSSLIQHGDRRLLEQHLKRFAERLAALKARLPVFTDRSTDEGLAKVQDSARAERARHAALYPYGLLGASTRAFFDAPHVCLEIRPEGSPWMAARVTARDFWSWSQAPKLECDCCSPMCIHRIIALECLGGPFVLDPEIGGVLRDALRPTWERVLEAIAPTVAPRVRKPGVLSFKVGPRGAHFSFHEVGKRGPSAKGKRTTAREVLSRLEGLDHRIAERFALAEATSGSGPSPLLGDGLLLLEGHPRVYWEQESEPIPVARAEGMVKVAETASGFRLEFLVGGVAFDPDSKVYECTDGAVVLLRGADRRVLLTHVSEPYLRLVAAARKLGSELPREAAPRLIELLPALEAGALVELPDDLRGEERPPVARPLVRVAAAATGLSLSIRVEPLEHGPVFVPGLGLPVSASFDGRRRSYTRRSFERELAEANALAGALGLDPSLAAEPYAWLLDGSDRHVETLRRLSGAGVAVEWLAPKVKFTSEAKLDRLRLAIERKKDWFGLDGEVTVDDRRVSLAALLEAARERRRFVKLGDGDFAQLSEAMLEALAPLSHLSREGALPQLTPGTAPLIEALAPQLEALDAAKEWSALMERLTKAKTATFPVPRALKGTLRDYQVEGFQWLSRLAQWGVGACLADDMGLGKTLQALALLLSRGKQGPALVVAPSSVLHNWRAEAAKFAPTLKLKLFHEGDRALGTLGAMEVVVVSWSLLAREAEAFAAVRFTTVVLDEAHAIKNADTLRARAAHRLQADFLVALSGTPIENHVGELWSLFKAVMPTLLGSEEFFRQRFSSGQKEALAALSILVRPFVLRRTKGAVARELPSRTELELVIPLSLEERALYDDVRLSAMSELADVTGESKRFEVLAALTRLRLTACHPKLVDERWAGPTSKLSRLLELVESLSAAGHRVLVFSQFTRHLALVVEALRAQGVAFSYLDGQVPLAERHRRVEAFQQGAGGDVFLVSLKAGGTGLNLTAADYVIHLDPWWNPAVEDQASDRAHRIGQTRPVTVYRLIAEGTIEQQILSLHRDKRELVDALLSGADTVGKLSTTQLADLIRSS